MTKKRQKRRWTRVWVMLGVLAAAGLFAFIPFLQEQLHPTRYIKSPTSMLEVTDLYMDGEEVNETIFSIPRGAKVSVEEKGDTESSIRYENHILRVKNENLAASLAEVVDFDTIYPRKLVNLRDGRGGNLTDVAVAKGEALKVVSINPDDLDPTTGEIAWFEVEKDGRLLWVAGSNMEMTQENALKTYGEGFSINPVYDNIYYKGFSQDAYVDQADLKGRPKKSYEDNPLRDDIQAVHVTLNNAIHLKDYLLQVADQTPLNALVIGMKGPEGRVFYDTQVPSKYYNDTTDVMDSVIVDQNQLKSLLQEYKDHGIYVIARLETFMDETLSADRIDLAITDSTGERSLYSDSHWVSPYSREVWAYNGDLAKELASLGFNEIQFDFVRFPDGTTRDTELGNIHMINPYNESKTAALQGFLFYIQEELEPYQVYVAADVYGGTVIEDYDYDVGHFLPAIAAACDVVNPMIYLDTFNTSSYGFTDTNGQAREILNAFALDAYKELETVPRPAVMRLWLQGYGNTSDERLAREINGLMDAGQSGWMIWTDQGSPDMIDPLKNGFVETGNNTIKPQGQ